MGCRMTKKSKKYAAEVSDETSTMCPTNLAQMKRKDLQKLCKKLNLKAIGKNVELLERLQSYYNELELKEVNKNYTKTEDIVKSTDNTVEDTVEHTNNIENIKDQLENGDVIDSASANKAIAVEDIDAASLPNKELEDENCLSNKTSNPSSPKDWHWIARWCVVDGVLKQDAKDRWVLLQLLGGRTVLVDEQTKERSDFVLEPTILPTPDDYEDNYICGDCVRKNHEQLSGWIGIQKTRWVETPKSCLGKENYGSDSLLRQSFKRKRDEVLSPRNDQDFIEVVDNPLKVRRLNPRPSCSPASPHMRRERGEDFQLPKNLLKPWKPKKTKSTPPKEDPDFAQKVEKIITNLSPEEQLTLVFGAKKQNVMHSPQPLK